MNIVISEALLILGVAAAVWLVVYYTTHAVRSQVLGETFWRGPRGTNAVALTFDDGPGEETAEILDVLADNGLKATFFLIGERVKKQPDIVSRIVAEGHEIGNHSFTHRIFLYSSPGRVFQELKETQRTISEVAGFEPRIARPPCGVRCPAYFRAAKSIGLTTIQWDVAGFDWKIRYPVQIAEAVLRRVRPGSVILLHDGDSKGNHDRKPTVAAIPLIVAGLRNKGLQIVPLQELIRDVERCDAAIENMREEIN